MSRLKYLLLTVWSVSLLFLLQTSAEEKPWEQHKSYGEYVPLKIDSTIARSKIWQKSASHLQCIDMCYQDKRCISFGFDEIQQVCHGYNANYYRNDNPSLDTGFFGSLSVKYFFDKYLCLVGVVALVDRNGYTTHKNEGICYKLYQQSTKENIAKDTCKKEFARLLPIINTKQNKIIKDLIKSSKTLASQPGILVDGRYQSSTSTFRYSNGNDIKKELWSKGKKNVKYGNCVIATKRGLSAAKCSIEHYFFCGL